MARFQILSLAGGGIRGAYITSFLNDLEQKLGQPIAESFDLIAGTSTGGIIAAGLALGLPASAMHDFYVRHGAGIFAQRPPYRAHGLMRLLYPPTNWVFKRRTGSSLDAAFRARYCHNALEAAFEEGFGDATLKSIEYTRLAIPAVNLTKGKPHVFRSRHLPKGVHDQDFKLADVVIAATAAPTYFPYRQIGECSYIDGGVWAADPSMLAVAEAMRVQQFGACEIDGTCFSTDDIHLLSVGTGVADYSLSPPTADTGMLYWASRIADVMGMSQIQGIHLPLKFLLGDRYRHINFKMEKKFGLADVENIPELFRLGSARADASFDTINEEFFQHKRVKFEPFTTTDGEIILDEFGVG